MFKTKKPIGLGFKAFVLIRSYPPLSCQKQKTFRRDQRLKIATPWPRSLQSAL